MTNKLIIFKKGALLNCFLNIPIEEAKRRYEELDKEKSGLQLKQEENHPVQMDVVEFEDHFEIWNTAEAQDFVDLILKERFGHEEQ